MTPGSEGDVPQQRLVVLQDPVAHRIALLLTERPMESRELLRALGVGWDPLTRGLLALESEGIAESSPAGEGRRTYSLRPGVEIPRFPIPRGRRVEIARFVQDNPDCTREQVATALKMETKTVQFHVRALVDAELLTLTTVQESETYSATPRLSDLLKVVP